jgi:hypothetical protein
MRRSLGIAFASLPALLFSPSARAEPGVRLLRSTAEEVSVEINAPTPETAAWMTAGEWVYSVPGWVTTARPGAPELPCTRFQLAVPPGTRPVMTVRMLATGSLAGKTPRPAPQDQIVARPQSPPEQRLSWDRDEALYARGFPESWAVLGRPANLRSLRIVPVDVYPYRWDPQAGAVRIATRMEIDIRFEEDHPLSLPRNRPADVPLVSESSSWTRLYRQSVLNVDQSGVWLRSPAPWPGSRLRRAPPVGPELRIEVDHSDMYRVTYDDLVAAGWDQTGVQVDQLAMVERFFDEGDTLGDPFHENDVPIVVKDGNGVFDAGDEIYFFGLSAWERLHPLQKDKRYGRANSYFLTLRPEGGARMASAPSFLGQSLTPESSFTWTDHLEQDGIYMIIAASGDSLPPTYLSSGVNAIRGDHFSWTGGEPDTIRVPFDLPSYQAPLRLRIGMQGIKTPNSGQSALVSFRTGVPGSLVALPDLVVPLKSAAVLDLGEAELAPLHLAATGNILEIAEDAARYGAALNWMEWTTRRSFTAAGDRLAWSTNGLTGPREFDAQGFGAGDLLVFDLTDSVFTSIDNRTPAGPKQLTYRTDQYQGGTLRLQLDLGDSGRPRTLLAMAAESMSRPAAIERVSSVDLKTPEGADEDLILIAAPEFLEAVAPLVQQRQSQGLSVRAVSIRDVFDQFNGGRPWPTAIRNYLRYLWRARTVKPSYLLLVGEASDDFAHVTHDSGPNLVPTQTVLSNAWAEAPELVSSDEWYVDNLADPTLPRERLDFYPDMAVGRLSVSTADECQRVVSKLVKYDQYLDSDSWRTRGLFVSDDEYSSTIQFSGTYQWKGIRPMGPGTDTAFRWTAREITRMIRDQAGFPGFAADSFYTGAYMDTVACLGRCRNPITNGSDDCSRWRCPPDSGSASWYKLSVPYSTDDPFDTKTDNLDWASTYLPPKLRAYMNGQNGGGYLFVSYQGHANKGIMSHEWIFVDLPFIRDDVSLLHNAWPFFFMGYGCHLAEFAAASERFGGVEADCISEKLMSLNDDSPGGGHGAIAAYASTAFEWLSANHIPDLALFQSWFVDPPQVNGRSRWILGEVVTGSKWTMMKNWGAGSNSTVQGMVATYMLLGDPSMPMEMGAPSLDVRVNCPRARDWDACDRWADGQSIAAAAGTDSAFIRLRLTDEAHVGQVTLLDHGVAVPDSLYRLESDTLPPGGDRALWLLYTPRLMPPLEDYEIGIQVSDDHGLVRNVSLPVRLGADFSVLRAQAYTAIRPGDILEPGDSVQVELESPVDLADTQLGLWVDDTPAAGVRAVSNDARHWTLTGSLPAEIPEAAHQLQVRVRREDGQFATRGVEFQAPGAGDVRLLEVYNFPNPFEAGTGFYYRLSRSAEWARVRVFTLSGRRIWQSEGPALADRNVIPWDGRDQDGDEVANGLYFYKLEVHTTEGKSLSRIERAVRMR